MSRIVSVRGPVWRVALCKLVRRASEGLELLEGQIEVLFEVGDYRFEIHFAEIVVFFIFIIFFNLLPRCLAIHSESTYRFSSLGFVTHAFS